MIKKQDITLQIRQKVPINLKALSSQRNLQCYFLKNHYYSQIKKLYLKQRKKGNIIVISYELTFNF